MATTWWDIHASSMTLAPPIQYGVTPAGASENTPSTPLPSDRFIEVMVFDLAGHGLGGAQLAP